MPETSFLRRLLPDTGLICVAMALPKGGFRHFFCESLEQAEQQITWLENSEQTVFLAQATFETNKNRKQSNTLQVRNSFWTSTAERRRTTLTNLRLFGRSRSS